MPTPAAMSLSDVPSYPVVAKHVTASSRMASRVERIVDPACDVATRPSMSGTRAMPTGYPGRALPTSR